MELPNPNEIDCFCGTRIVTTGANAPCACGVTWNFQRTSATLVPYHQDFYYPSTSCHEACRLPAGHACVDHAVNVRWLRAEEAQNGARFYVKWKNGTENWYYIAPKEMRAPADTVLNVIICHCSNVIDAAKINPRHACKACGVMWARTADRRIVRVGGDTCADPHCILPAFHTAPVHNVAAYSWNLDGQLHVRYRGEDRDATYATPSAQYFVLRNAVVATNNVTNANTRGAKTPYAPPTATVAKPRTQNGFDPDAWNTAREALRSALTKIVRRDEKRGALIERLDRALVEARNAVGPNREVLRQSFVDIERATEDVEEQLVVMRNLAREWLR